MSSGQRKGEATRIDIVEANQLYAELPRPYNSFYTHPNHSIGENKDYEPLQN
jgi:hypothetical protein